jgi:hypothetical protein
MPTLVHRLPFERCADDARMLGPQSLVLLGDMDQLGLAGVFGRPLYETPADTTGTAGMGQLLSHRLNSVIVLRHSQRQEGDPAFGRERGGATCCTPYGASLPHCFQYIFR